MEFFRAPLGFFFKKVLFVTCVFIYLKVQQIFKSIYIKIWI